MELYVGPVGPIWVVREVSSAVAAQDRADAATADALHTPSEMWMENNRAWIRKQMEDGCTIYDCGPAPGRANFPGPTSPYYKMELDELRAYPNYIRVSLGE